MNRIVAVVTVLLAAAPSCLAQTTGPERIELAPAGAADWAAGGPAGGEICAIAQGGRNAEVLYAGTTAGVFRSTDGGSTWGMASNGLPRLGGLCYKVTTDPNRPATLFAEVFTRVYKTTDGGASWAPIDAGLSESSLLTVDPTNSDRLYIESDRKIFKSLNGGQRWTPIRAAGLPLDEVGTAVLVDHTNPAALYVGTEQGVFKSTDAGETWSSADPGLRDEHVSLLAMDPTNSAILYAATGGQVFQSMAGGRIMESRGRGASRRNQVSRR